MREEIVNLDNNISIHISRSDVPPLDEGVTVECRRRMLSDMHLHNEYEFLRVDRGIFRCVTLDGEFVLHEGDIIFINKYVPHSTFEETSDTHSTLIQFRLPSDGDSITRYISRFTSISDTPACVFKKGTPEFEEIRHSFDTILDEYAEKKPYWSDYIYNHMRLLLASLRRQGVISDEIQKKREDINKIRPVLEYINNNCGERLSTADLSSMFNFNEQYFCRLFKSIVGTSPMNYINFVRVSKAEKLLKTETSLLKVANDMGFSSLSYFNRVFKKYKHYSPGEYKKIIRTREFE
ncbi:MAG: helix-turn-helix transcriptional regulator [Clostridia bacterium]|nr:helix-turn-helix transcriptional regulator [Clostridia bacterium]